MNDFRLMFHKLFLNNFNLTSIDAIKATITNKFLSLIVEVRNVIGKWFLKELLFRRLPKYLRDLSQMRFGALTIISWLRSPLKDWVEYLLDKNCLIQSGCCKSHEVQKELRQRISPENNWQFYFWDIEVFESIRHKAGL